MKCIKQIIYRVAPVLLLAAQPVFAHPLHGDAAGGFTAGLAHPLLGVDHLLVMIAVGVWAAQLGGAAIWKVPLAFVVTLLIGAGAGLYGVTLPGIEPMIAASVVALGLVISMRAQLLPWLAGLLVAAFALFHGQAHMVALPVGASALAYVSGFVLTTAILHGAGIAAGHLLHCHTDGAMLRAGGMGLAGVGFWLLVGV